ncbi:Ig-like domain repeat protein, partial [Dietzia cinnamea]
MSPTPGGTTATTTRRRRWLRSLTVILSSLALILGLAPSAHSQALQVSPPSSLSHDKFDFTQAINTGGSNFIPGGTVQVDNSVKFNGSFTHRWSNIRRWGVITDPTGFGYQSHTGQSMTNTRASGNFVGGDLTDTRIDDDETRRYQLKMRIPSNAMGGQRFNLGLQAEVTNDWNVINYPNRIWFVLPAVATNISPLTFSPNPGRPGEPVTVTARVNATYGTNTPTGTVRFVVEGQTYTATVNNGVATAQITRPTAGTKSVTATFTPANSAQWQTSNRTNSYSLNTETTATDLTLDEVEVTAGGTVEATASVSPTTAVGDVRFSIPGYPAQTVPLAGGTASASIPVDAAGSYTVTAEFIPADPERYTTSSDTETVNVSAEQTQTSVTVTPAEALVGQNVTITAAVSPAAAGGTMTFEVDGESVVVPVVDGEASLTRQFDANGDYPVTATFTPENPSRYAGSSGTGVVAVGLQDTATVLTLEQPTVTAGGTVTASAQVSPAGAAGTVTFTVAGQEQSVAVDAEGRASAQFQIYEAGAYLVTAAFAPTNTDQYRPSSDEAGVTVEVEGTETEVTVAPTVARVGEPTTLTANVTPAEAAGTVTFEVDGQEYTATVTDGVATATHTFTTTGEHPVTATFTPADPDRYGSSTGTATATVSAEATTTDLTLSEVEMTAGGTLTATAAVTPAGAVGDVVFTVDGQTQRVTLADGQSTAEFQLDAAGTYTVTAVFEPTNPDRYTTSTDSETVTVEVEGTETAVTVAPTVARVGEPTTLTATVTPAEAAGTVTFEVDGQEYTATVTDGVATATHTFTTTGEHPVTATFTPADPDRYGTSTGTATATVSSEVTTTDLTLSEVEMTAGGTLTATAAVTPAGAVGDVVFTVAGQTQRVALADGQATAEFQLDAAGTYTVTATFEPTNPARYTTSTDSETVAVETEGTETSVEVSPVPARAGEPATLRATVSPAEAAGTVTFEVDGQEYTATVTDGVATAEHTFTETGTYPVTATFTPADPDRYGTSTGTASATVSAEATATDVTVTPTRVVAGESVEFTATVTPADAAGTVDFTLDGVTKTVAVSGGVAVATFDVTSAGEKTVTAEFTPTNPERFTASSDTATFNSIANATSTELSVSPVSARAGQEVVLTTTVTPGDVAGTVLFEVDGQEYTATVTDGVATARHTFDTTGEHTVRATFTPTDTEANSPSSDVATVVVSAEATTTQVTVDPVRAVAGESVTVTARVTPANAAGTVTFDFGDGSAPVEATVSGGVATATHTFAEAGDYEISGEFTPANPQRYTASEDTTNVFVTPEPIEQAETTVTLEPVTGAVAGQPVDITATVTPDVPGEVHFTIDGRTMVVPVTDGEAVLTHTFATDGDHPVQAEFVPADREAYAGSVDTATVTVAPAPEEPGEEPPITGSIGDLFFWVPGTQGTLGSNSGSLGSSQPSASSLP